MCYEIEKHQHAKNMCPYINCFIVYHKQTFDQLFKSVEIYSISTLYVLIMVHKQAV